MFIFIKSQIFLYLAIGIVLFLPGYFLILATGIKKHLSSLETFVISLAASIAATDFLVIILGKSPFAITRISILSAITILCCASYCIYHFLHKKKKAEIVNSKFSRRNIAIVLLLIFLTIFIKAIYFTDTIYPTTTDLGHHMYWAKSIAVSGQLPQYEKTDIEKDLTIGQPKPIADFIIGEHLIFAAIALISNSDFISPFPSLILFLFNVATALAIFILALELFKEHEYGNTIAIIALFLAGPLYSLTSPQAKFVSGGVIGNTIGNLLIPIAILFFIKALSEKKKVYLAWAIFTCLALAYTHHLSTLIFMFIFAFTVLMFILTNHKDVLSEAKQWLKMLVSPWVILPIAFGLIFIFYLYTPTYLNTSAIDTAMGSPTKSTRTGLTLTQLKVTAGEARFAFAAIGFLFILLSKNVKKYRQAFLLGWFMAICVMSLEPDWMLIDIPSNRISSYIVFPASLVAAYMIVWILETISHAKKHEYGLKPAFSIAIFFFFFLFLATNGLRENSDALNTGSSMNGAMQTYAASEYLAQRTNPQDIVLKDHNYIAGDSWIKLFFMRGYSYPLSRGYFKRYEDSATREQCTNLMISLPSSPEAIRCFEGTKTDFIMVDPSIDGSQFERIKNFWKVYSSDEVAIYHKNS